MDVGSKMQIRAGGEEESSRQEKNYRSKVWVGGGKVDRGASEVWKLLLKEGASLSPQEPT